MLNEFCTLYERKSALMEYPKRNFAWKIYLPVPPDSFLNYWHIVRIMVRKCSRTNSVQFEYRYVVYKNRNFLNLVSRFFLYRNQGIFICIILKRTPKIAIDPKVNKITKNWYSRSLDLCFFPVLTHFVFKKFEIAKCCVTRTPP